jgi:hypothetical protein
VNPSYPSTEDSVESDVRAAREQIVDMQTAWGKPEKAAEWRKMLPPSM